VHRFQRKIHHLYPHKLKKLTWQRVLQNNVDAADPYHCTIKPVESVLKVLNDTLAKQLCHQLKQEE
jgi:hypothetical protein